MLSPLPLLPISSTSTHSMAVIIISESLLSDIGPVGQVRPQGRVKLHGWSGAWSCLHGWSGAGPAREAGGHLKRPSIAQIPKANMTNSILVCRQIFTWDALHQLETILTGC